MKREDLDLRTAEHAEMDRQMAEFLAGGGQIEVVPRGLLRSDPDTVAQRLRHEAAKKAAVARTAVEVAAGPAAHRIPNAKRYDTSPVTKKAVRGPGKATTREKVPVVRMIRQPTAWERVAVALREANRPLYVGELRLMTGLPSSHISVAISVHAADVERIGRRPLTQYRLRKRA